MEGRIGGTFNPTAFDSDRVSPLIEPASARRFGMRLPLTTKPDLHCGRLRSTCPSTQSAARGAPATARFASGGTGTKSVECAAGG